MPEQINLSEVYENNPEFKAYIDRYRRKNPIPFEELYQHKMIMIVAGYYTKKGDN